MFYVYVNVGLCSNNASLHRHRPWHFIVDTRSFIVFSYVFMKWCIGLLNIWKNCHLWYHLDDTFNVHDTVIQIMIFSICIIQSFMIPQGWYFKSSWYSYLWPLGWYYQSSCYCHLWYLSDDAFNLLDIVICDVLDDTFNIHDTVICITSWIILSIFMILSFKL